MSFKLRILQHYESCGFLLVRDMILAGNFGIKPGTGNRIRLTGNRLESEPAWTGTGLNRNLSEQYRTVLYSTVQYCAVLCSTVQYCTVLFRLYSTVQYGTVLYSTVQYCTVLYSTVQYCTVLHSTVLCSTVQYGTCTVLYSTVQYCIVLYSTVQYCTVPWWSWSGALFFIEGRFFD